MGKMLGLIVFLVAVTSRGHWEKCLRLHINSLASISYYTSVAFFTSAAAIFFFAYLSGARGPGEIRHLPLVGGDTSSSMDVLLYYLNHFMS